MRIVNSDDNASKKPALGKAGTLALVGLVLAVVATAMAMSKKGKEPFSSPLKDRGVNAGVNGQAQPRTERPDGMVSTPGGDFGMGAVQCRCIRF
jgi:hypothetical protein